MKSIRILSFAIGLGTVSLALATDPVGVWAGKIEIKFPPVPAGMDARQKAAMLQAKKQFAQGKIKLILKKDKTFTAHATGLPMLGDPDNKGTWSQTGDTILMTDKKDKRPQVFKLSKNGKTLIFKLPKDQGQIVFVR